MKMIRKKKRKSEENTLQFDDNSKKKIRVNPVKFDTHGTDEKSPGHYHYNKNNDNSNKNKNTK